MTEEPQDEIEQLELLRRIRAQAQVDGSRITLARDVLADAFAADLRGLVDEDWYLDRYPDVADAVGRGMLGSGADHYLQAGIYEGRMPYRVRLDSADYLETHPDVESSIQEGAFRSALDHFVRAGFAEGRAFTLASPEPEDP